MLVKKRGVEGTEVVFYQIWQEGIMPIFKLSKHILYHICICTYMHTYTIYYYLILILTPKFHPLQITNHLLIMLIPPHRVLYASGHFSRSVFSDIQGMALYIIKASMLNDGPRIQSCKSSGSDNAAQCYHNEIVLFFPGFSGQWRANISCGLPWDKGCYSIIHYLFSF